MSECLYKWQYRVERYSLGELEKPGYLGPLGEASWELVCMKRVEEKKPAAQIQWLAVFKRPSVISEIEDHVEKALLLDDDEEEA